MRLEREQLRALEEAVSGAYEIVAFAQVFKKGAKRPIPLPEPLEELSADDRHEYPGALPISQLSYDIDGSSSKPFSAALTIPMEYYVANARTSLVPRTPNDLLTPYGNRVRITLRVTSASGSKVDVSLPWGLIQTVEMRRPSPAITLTLADLAEEVDQFKLLHNFPSKRQRKEGKHRVTWLVKEMLALAVGVEDEPSSGHWAEHDGLWIPKLHDPQGVLDDAEDVSGKSWQAGTSAWDAITEAVSHRGGRIFFDRHGLLVVQRALVASDPSFTEVGTERLPAATIASGSSESSNLIEIVSRISRENFLNGVLVRVEDSDVVKRRERNSRQKGHSSPPLKGTYPQTAGEYYSDNTFHGAADYGCPSGTKVYAVIDATVAYVRDDVANGIGNYPNGPQNVIVLNGHWKGEKVTIQYGHLSPNSAVKKGDKVAAGDFLGRSGYTGNVRPPGAAGAHLHISAHHGWDDRPWQTTEGNVIYPPSQVWRGGTRADTGIEDFVAYRGEGVAAAYGGAMGKATEVVTITRKNPDPDRAKTLAKERAKDVLAARAGVQRTLAMVTTPLPHIDPADVVRVRLERDDGSIVEEKHVVLRVSGEVPAGRTTVDTRAYVDRYAYVRSDLIGYAPETFPLEEVGDG